MTIDCTNISLKKGSSGDKVKQVQTILKNKGYYPYNLDGDYGDLTVTAVKNFQKTYGLAVDGWIGPITCNKLQTTTSTNTTKTTNTKSYYKNGIYHSGDHWISPGCNKRGQCTSYFCGVHSLKQNNSKQDIDQFNEYTLASYAGTTSKGTSHQGIETAIAKVAQLLGIKIKVEWYNFSDLGNTVTERFKKIGEWIATQNIGVIWHTLYKNLYGHYEIVRDINMNNNTCTVINSLGSKCSSTGYCGYLETRSFNTMKTNLAGISQKSICKITYL